MQQTIIVILLNVQSPNREYLLMVLKSRKSVMHDIISILSQNFHNSKKIYVCQNVEILISRDAANLLETRAEKARRVTANFSSSLVATRQQNESKRPNLRLAARQYPTFGCCAGCRSQQIQNVQSELVLPSPPRPAKG
jgi:hypothetical protein